jgi:hypothetical protein
MCDRADGKWVQRPVTDIEPIYEIRSALDIEHAQTVRGFSFGGGHVFVEPTTPVGTSIVDPHTGEVHRVQELPVDKVRVRGVERDVAEFDPPPTIHHLSVDPSHEITLHGTWAGWRGDVVDKRTVAPDEYPIERHNPHDDEFPS